LTIGHSQKFPKKGNASICETMNVASCKIQCRTIALALCSVSNRIYKPELLDNILLLLILECSVISGCAHFGSFWSLTGGIL